MKINSEDDVKQVTNLIHDAEFTDADFGCDTQKGIFFIELKHKGTDAGKFRLEFYNVEEYNPINLDKIKAGKATGGVFNYIKIINHGHILKLISQDLEIELKLSKLSGLFQKIEGPT